MLLADDIRSMLNLTEEDFPTEDIQKLRQFQKALRYKYSEKGIKERIETRCGRHITEYAEELGLGTTDYELISID